jgi:ABC-type transport system involved in multi-copper enzyme maturation permease subunit
MRGGTLTGGTISAYQSETGEGRDRFAQLLRAEWTKFRTIRGWLAGMIIAAVVTVGIAALDHASCGGIVMPGGSVTAGQGCSSPVGPGGQAVTDSPYLVHQPLGTEGSITVRVTSLSGQPAGPASAGTAAGLQPWSKAGIIIKASDRPGSAYAAVMVTGGHGVVMQYDYTGDTAGPPGPVSAASPRWLRLIRSGDNVTGYESADGTRWHVVGTAHLAGLPATALAGLFAASPAGSTSAASSSISGSSGGSGANLATARFDHVIVRGGQPGRAWAGGTVGGNAGGPADTGFHQAGGTFTVTGSGDIAPDVPAASGGDGFAIEHTLLGIFGALVAVIVVAVMFMTAEYRRGLIKVTLAASPRRGRVLAAKAVVIGSVSFAAGLIGSAAALLTGEHLLRSNGNFIMPVSTLTEVRVVAGTAALTAVTAILALAVGALLRSSAAAVTLVISVVVLPYLLENTVLPAGAADWVLRITPAAGFAIQQSLPQYPQVAASYTPANGYFPLTPWAGFAVLCGYAALALAVAAIILRRRDA